MEPDLMTIEEVASVLRCSDKTVRLYCASARLPVVRIGGKILVPRAALDELVRAATLGPAKFTMDYRRACTTNGRNS
jgi:excisionase family DNA binding protein